MKAAGVTKGKIGIVGVKNPSLLCSSELRGLAKILKTPMKAAITQNPDVMGYEGVKAAVRVLNGEDLKGLVVDTGVNVIRKKDIQ